MKYPPETFWSMCQGKNAYPSQKVASQYLRGIQRARRNRKKRLRTYNCPYCKKWHLTSQ